MVIDNKQQLVTAFEHLGADAPEDVLFLHANGFPPETYQQCLSEIQSVRRLYTVEHRPLWDADAPGILHWSKYADDTLTVLRRERTEPVWLLGHSMGGAISLMLAARAPELVKGVILLDPVVFSSRFWLFAKVTFWLWPDRSKMVQSALRRPHEFESLDAAFNFYRSKRAFSGIQDQGLWDYVNAAHEPQDDGLVKLRYSGEWEACVYRSPPNLWSTIGKIRQPISVLAGRQSYVVLPSIAEKLSSYPSVHFDWMDAGHLLPLEAPTATAQWVTAQLGSSVVN